ncbi:DNA circularization protein [Alloalcanivorax xenomutans]|uniref:DNA circularization protein n=1 Tax=Alloalcanivorax xenomutans TaxID=1094342 RepID=UPI003C63A369
MTWRDEITDEGQFRSARFYVEEHGVTGGRRIGVHQYPGRDDIWPEDDGRRPRGYNVSAFVIGEDYVAARNALIDALEEPGEGRLRHPWLGTLQVVVDTYRLRETTRNGGTAEFAISFLPAGERQFPTEAPDTRVQVRDAASAVRAAIQTRFEAQYSTAGAPAWSIAAIRDRLTDLAVELRAGSGDLVDKITSPADLAKGLIDAVVGLYSTATASVSDLRRALDWGRLFPAITLNTPLRRQQARNESAIRDIAQVTGAASGAERLADTDFPSQQEAGEALEAITDVIDSVQSNTDPEGNPIDDTVYYRLQDLRAAVVADVRQRGLRLPEVASYTPDATMPALLIAHHLYGDATREADIVTRNRLRHPGFVPGGQPLEVLRDV